MTDAELLEVQARHETGHAVMAEDLTWPVSEIVLEMKKETVGGIPSTTFGHTAITYPKPVLETLGLHAAVALAGYTAVRRTADAEKIKSQVPYVGLDWYQLNKQFQDMNLELGHRLAAIYEGVAEAERTISKHEEAIEKIIVVLVQHKRINREGIRKIMRESDLSSE